MRAFRILLLISLVVVAATILYAGLQRRGPNRFEAPVSPGSKVALDLSAGGYQVRGTSEDKVRVQIDSGEADEVHCHITPSGAKTKVELDGPNNNFHAIIYVPQRSDLEVNQTIGDLVISNVEGNKNLALGIGRMELQLPSATTHSFDGTVLLGSLRADTWHVEKGGFFRGYQTRSSGAYAINAHVDIGDLEVVD